MDDGEIPATSRASSEPSASGGGVVDGVEGPAVRHEGCDALARAIASTLGAMMREFDSRAEGTARSQDELSLSLDRLTGESSMASGSHGGTRKRTAGEEDGSPWHAPVRGAEHMVRSRLAQIRSPAAPTITLNPRSGAR
ncbi:hypothetical protein B296_00001648 [Ensete ventricosum]|uniref:Uncharacterized protein n=1 Tax=Ensete ventricosum TaxID=4639 RepID=A0A426ZYV0_ENSVE|nr:hypothetical protein B296_00001648 [Ensete ventricosum]